MECATMIIENGTRVNHFSRMFFDDGNCFRRFSVMASVLHGLLLNVPDFSRTFSANIVGT